MKTFIFIVLILISTLAHGQSRSTDPNVRIARPFGISGNLGGGSILGISLDYFVIPQLSIEAGAGLSQYVAVKYHFVGGNKDIHWSPFIGAAFCFPTIVAEDFDGLGFFSFPLGVHYIANSGFSFSIAFAISIYSDDYGNGPVLPWGGLRIGYHF
jgi:hypothetical protein